MCARLPLKVLRPDADFGLECAPARLTAAGAEGVSARTRADRRLQQSPALRPSVQIKRRYGGIGVGHERLSTQHAAATGRAAGPSRLFDERRRRSEAPVARRDEDTIVRRKGRRQAEAEAAPADREPNRCARRAAGREGGAVRSPGIAVGRRRQRRRARAVAFGALSGRRGQLQSNV